MFGVFKGAVARSLLSEPITSSRNVTLQVFLLVIHRGAEVRVGALHDAVVPVIEALNGGVVQGLVLTLLWHVGVRPIEILSFAT